RDTAREYEADGVQPADAMQRAVAEHLAEARREEAHIVATVREKFTAAGGKLAEIKAEAPALVEAKAEPGGVADTPAFQAWFGDSKAVDKDGKPLVVYHGTNADVAELKSKGDLHPGLPWTRGIYFT